ncbi:hypothetical protein [Natronosalvus rutilus]|uniref:Uncharacterized protein n=1 Tax=Natronosalvus rutilus TaxID=2953753 RepID=A0A9E7N9S9_9EURY|nr:hypothetical protein [Natronosalvus rutilus]UTF52983.1 hypothetical protein NGM29_14540 [Natronosalvus rutilus]
MYSGLIFESLPWWIAAPLLQLGILVFGMALDETYVNRATVLTGAIALYTHSVIAGGVWMPVGLYLDIGVVIGAYGLYAYVVDAYVANWFRVAAFFVYSPLSVFLVILLPDVVFPLALVLAGYANLQLMASLEPTEPYYFGPDSPDEFEDAVAATDEGEKGTEDGTESGPDVSNEDSSSGHLGAGPAPTGGDSDERGVLPEFMRRL